LAALTGSPQPPAVTADELDDDEFFERAASGEALRSRAASVGEADRRAGAASLPRTSRSRRRPPRSRRPRARSSRPDDAERPTRRLGTRRWIGAAAVGSAGALAFAVAITALLGGSRQPGSEVASRSPIPVASRAAVDFAPPTLVDAPRVANTGTLDVRGSARDPAGVRTVRLWVDGKPADSKAPHCRGACPTRLGFDLGRVTGDGDRPRSVALTASDHSGNSAVLWHLLLVPDSQPAARLTLALDRGRRRWTTSRHPQPYALAGRLTDSHGRPAAHARVELIALARTAGATPETAAVARTDADGRWRVAALRTNDGSRTYVARHNTHDGRAIASGPVEVTVRAAPIATVRTLDGGRRVVVGRLPVSPDGARVSVLAARRHGGGWRAVAAALAGPASGRFELAIARAPRGRLAVFAAPSAGWPYAPAGRRFVPAARQQ
jgi:hypothetical protein